MLFLCLCSPIPINVHTTIRYCYVINEIQILKKALLHGKEFRVKFSSAEGFGTEFREFASILVPRNGTPSCVLFRGRVRNGIPRFSVPRKNRNSVGNNHLFRLFRLPRNYFFGGNSQP